MDQVLTHMTEPLAPITDTLGHEIVVGAKVIYPVRAGSSMWIEEGEVTEVGREAVGWFDKREVPFIKVRKQSGKVVKVTALDRVVAL